MHTGDDNLLGRFTGAFETLAESLDQRIAPQRRNSRHVQNTANAGSATTNGAFAFEAARVAIERGDADKSRDLAMIDFAKFRQLSDQRRGEHLANTRRALQGACKLLPLIVGVDVVVDLAIQFGDLFVQRGDDRVDGTQSCLAGRGASAIDLFRSALDELPTASDQSGEFRLDLQAFFKQSWRSELPESCQQMSVDGVSLGQDAQAFGEVTHVAWIDQRHRQIRFQQSFEHGTFESSGGLDDDAGRLNVAEFFQQRLDACGIVGLSPGGLAVGASDVEELFGDVDAYGRHGR